PATRCKNQLERSTRPNFYSIKLTRVNRTNARNPPSPLPFSLLIIADNFLLDFSIAQLLNCSMFASKRSQELGIVNDEIRSSFNCIRVQLYE
ncbi:hypothetical protein AB4369_18420, partial [Vibrio sp. 10N.261.49.A5]